MNWPKAITSWSEGDTGYLSVPFTWLLPEARNIIRQKSMFIKRWIVGGPAVRLQPSYFDACVDVEVRAEMPGVLQLVAPFATRTTLGCIRNCPYCAISKIEGPFRELDEWPDRPVICDSNLLAASQRHFDRVIDRLVRWGWCDFNQGLDPYLLTSYHAERIALIGKPLVRLACDRDRDRQAWGTAVNRLRCVGIPQCRIRTYVLVGFEGTLEDDWRRCWFVESFRVPASPMWFHRPDAARPNEVTPYQVLRGWSPAEQRRIMRYFYKHSGRPLVPPHRKAAAPIYAGSQ